MPPSICPSIFIQLCRQRFLPLAAGDIHGVRLRRVVFYILVSNTNDHLHNHGFLYDGPDGWQLASAYDFNPVPVDIKPRVLSTVIDLDDGTASLVLALEVAAYFELTPEQAWKLPPKWAARWWAGGTL